LYVAFNDFSPTVLGLAIIAVVGNADVAIVPFDDGVPRELAACSARSDAWRNTSGDAVSLYRLCRSHSEPIPVADQHDAQECAP
jgi:hypothetical protein